MKPVKPTQILNRGIAIFSPSVNNYTKIKIEIFYSEKNPLFSYSYCQEDEKKIWEKTDQNFGKGVLFLYTTNKQLKKGFYKIKLIAITPENTTIKGEQIIGLLKSKDTLYIGFPYSSFGHIKLL